MSADFPHFIFFAILARQVKWLLMSESPAPPALIIVFNGGWIVLMLLRGKMCKVDPWDLPRASLQVIILQKKLCDLFTWDMTCDKPCLKWGHILASGSYFVPFSYNLKISLESHTAYHSATLFFTLNYLKKINSIQYSLKASELTRLTLGCGGVNDILYLSYF